MEPTTGIDRLARDVREELERLRDEVKVRMHLAGMDARDAWEELRPQLDRVEQQLGEATDRGREDADRIGDELRVQLHLGLLEAKERWQSLEPHVRGLAEQLKRAGDSATQSVEGGLDRAKLKAKLAEMDTGDLFAKQRQEWERTLRGTREQVTDLSTRALEELRGSLRTLRDRFAGNGHHGKDR